VTEDILRSLDDDDAISVTLPVNQRNDSEDDMDDDVMVRDALYGSGISL